MKGKCTDQHDISKDGSETGPGGNAARIFPSGASRNSDTGKLDFEGFLCPVTLKRYAEFMNSHRTMEDGSIRDSDNWQRGIPQQQLLKSLIRHLHDTWLHSRGFEELAVEDEQDSICGVIFNAMAYLRGTLVAKSMTLDDPKMEEIYNDIKTETAPDYADLRQLIADEEK